MEKRCIFAILAALILVGCDPIATKRVALQLPMPVDSAQATSKVIVETDETDAAIEIVDRVVRKHGLGDGGIYPNDGAGVLRWWGLTLEQAHEQKRGSLTCRVYLTGGHLQVLFAEFGRLSSSQAVKEMAAEIRSAFVERFGGKRVK